MIIYDLQCAKGHTFEGWFDDRESFEDQQQNSLITCPICNDASVSRIPSAFAIKPSHSAQELSESKVDLKNLEKKIIHFINNNFEDVGCNFAAEALKIHYGVVKPRNIKGMSTNEEEKMLNEEGIQFYKIPMPPPESPDADS